MARGKRIFGFVETGFGEWLHYLLGVAIVFAAFWYNPFRDQAMAGDIGGWIGTFIWVTIIFGIADQYMHHKTKITQL